MIFLRLFVVVFSVIIIQACHRQDQNSIPYVPVDIYIYASDPQFINLSVVSGWEYITGGSQGLIVYRRNADEFAAYDRHVPYHPEDNCVAEVDSTQITISDPCSGSSWLLYDGNVTRGPASLPLHSYRTAFDGTVLHIYN